MEALVSRNVRFSGWPFIILIEMSFQKKVGVYYHLFLTDHRRQHTHSCLMQACRCHQLQPSCSSSVLETRLLEMPLQCNCSSAAEEPSLKGGVTGDSASCHGGRGDYHTPTAELPLIKTRSGAADVLSLCHHCHFSSSAQLRSPLLTFICKNQA